MSPRRRLFNQIIMGSLVYHMLFFFNLAVLQWGTILARAVKVTLRPLWAL
jgi:hypothetical protein